MGITTYCVQCGNLYDLYRILVSTIIEKQILVVTYTTCVNLYNLFRISQLCKTCHVTCIE